MSPLAFSPHWAVNMANECMLSIVRRMRANSRYLHVMLAAGGAPDDKRAMASFAAAVQELKDARSRVTVPALLEVMDSYIRHHPWLAGFIRGRHDAGRSEWMGENPAG